MISDEQRFIWDTDSLREILKNHDPRNLIDATVFLRRLLMDDGEPLIVKISRTTGQKIQFRVFSSSTKEGMREFIDGLPVKQELSMVYLNPNPSISPDGNTNLVNLRKFFSTAINHLYGEVLTIKDVIAYVANVAGGVHKGKPRTTNNAELIDKSANTILINGLPYPLENIRNIINMSLPMLDILYKKLRA